jgi:hypothetical protein
LISVLCGAFQAELIAHIFEEEISPPNGAAAPSRAKSGRWKMPALGMESRCSNNFSRCCFQTRKSGCSGSLRSSQTWSRTSP